jgi:hypothetical protein
MIAPIVPSWIELMFESNVPEEGVGVHLICALTHTSVGCDGDRDRRVATACLLAPGNTDGGR